MRKSTTFFLFVTIGAAACAVLVLHARHGREDAGGALAVKAGLVGRLRLTDLCLFTEARYTRHPAMADLHAPFQDHPFALEHFPSGSLLAPPRFSREAP